MNRNYYEVKSNDGKIVKGYRNRRCAYNCYNKLIRENIGCVILEYNYKTMKKEVIKNENR